MLFQDTTYPAFQAIARELGVWPGNSGVRLTPYPTVRLTTGAQIRFRTAEDPDKLRGPNLSGVWLDEASLMDADAFSVAIASLREQGEQGWLSATFTPKGLTHWTYDRFGRLPSPPHTELFHARTGDNPFNPPDFEATLKDQYAPTLAMQELGGEFVDQDGAEFPSEWFGPNLWVKAFPAVMTLRVMFLDPAADAGKRGQPSKDPTAKPKTDYPCYIQLGIDEQKVIYVSAYMKRAPMTETISVGLELARQFQPLDAFGVEANGFQKMMSDELHRQAKAAGLMLPIHTVTNTTNKIIRIRRLTPYLARGEMRFVDTPGTRLLVEQLRSFPLGEHDDGPDAMEGATRLAGEMTRRRHRQVNGDLGVQLWRA